MPTKHCPYCSSDTGIRIILYGMPSEEPDPAIYTIGGCCISDDMPKYECIACGWEGINANSEEFIKSTQNPINPLEFET